MSSVVSPLPDAHAERIRERRRAIDDQLGVGSPLDSPAPHFTYQLAGSYDTGALRPALERLAGQYEPFTVRTNGVAVFTDSEPVVYVPVTRDRTLSRLHTAVWDAVTETATDTVEYYRPPRWVPHVTIGHVDRDEVGPVVDLLQQDDFHWEFTVDTIGYLDGSTEEIEMTFRLGES